VLFLLLLFAALGPARWQVRTGLGWQFDHVIGYFGFAVMFSLAWRRPLVVGGILMATAMLLEALQALTPDRCCDLQAAFYGVAGTLAGAVFNTFCGRVLSRLDRRPVLVLERLPRWPSRNTIDTKLAMGSPRGVVSAGAA
jgi:VanZ family protein